MRMGDISQCLRSPQFGYLLGGISIDGGFERSKVLQCIVSNDRRLGCLHKLFLVRFLSKHLHQNPTQHPSNNYLTEQVERQNRIEGLKI